MQDATNNTATQTEKKPGWQLLNESAEKIISISQITKITELPLFVQDELTHDLRLQCLARKDEIIPAGHFQEVTDNVIKASALGGEVWTKEAYDFILAQCGHARIDQFLAENEAWVSTSACPCGDPAHSELIMTCEAKEYHEREMKWMFCGPMGFGDIFSIWPM